MPVFKTRTTGIYRSTFLGTEEKEMTNQETGQQEPRLIWKFQELSDSTTAGQIDKITGTSMQSPNSNAHKMAAGIMGRKLQDGDDTDAKIGGVYDVVYGPNQAGTLTITNVIAVAPVSARDPEEAMHSPTAVAALVGSGPEDAAAGKAVPLAPLLPGGDLPF